MQREGVNFETTPRLLILQTSTPFCVSCNSSDRSTNHNQTQKKRKRQQKGGNIMKCFKQMLGYWAQKPHKTTVYWY